jgi:hypothetical protein
MNSRITNLIVFLVLSPGNFLFEVPGTVVGERISSN